MRILVIGGTGTVGSAVVRRLVENDAEFSVMSRSPAKLDKLPGKAHGVVGDLSKPETLETAFAGHDRLFLLTPLSRTEAQEGLAAVEAARKEEIERLVYLSVHDVEKCPQAPHFASKIEVQQAIEDSGVPWTLIMPNNFYQNDYWFQQPLTEHGVYPQPIGGAGLSRVDVRDIADAVVAALIEDGHLGQRYPLVGPDVLTGESTAAAWGRALGREVRYGGDDLERWAEQARAGLPGWMVDDFVIMYRFFQEKGLAASAEDLAQQARILAHPPRRFDDFAAETARAWRG
jgi:uncharacterized protein YbjT (DUF2867 family)